MKTTKGTIQDFNDFVKDIKCEISNQHCDLFLSLNRKIC